MNDEYELRAEEFLRKTKTEFKVEFLRFGLFFQDKEEKDKRDIYLITLKRGERVFKFEFGNSINESGEYILYPSLERIHLSLNSFGKPNKNIKGFGLLNNENSKKNLNFKNPSAYDVLACLTKYQPEDFKNFCDEFGYNEDSRTAEKIYNAVLNEWNNIKMLYTDEEILKLQEIQ
jgi:hypothetical protein